MRYSTARVRRDLWPSPVADEERGLIPYGKGSCRFRTSRDHLDLVVTAADADAEAAVRAAVTRDLLEPVDWQPLVRPAGLGDDAALMALDSTGWTAGSGFPSAQNRERTEFFSARRTPDTHLVAQVGGQVVGYVSVQPKTPFPEGAHVFALWGLVVAEEARRLGIASGLLAAAEDTARAGGAKKVGLRVLGSNAGAIRLYERHGYAVEGRHVDEFYIDGRYVDDLTLGKKL
jgi:ribosomal protein S18 acetylase RimI-like enzyme